MSLHSSLGHSIVGIAAGLVAIVAAAQVPPNELIADLTEELYELVDEKREEYKSDPSLLKETVDRRMRQHVDTLYSARLVLGRYGRGLD